jgi:hypothetical protein
MKWLQRLYIFSISGALGGLSASLLHQHFVLTELSGELTPTRRYFLLGVLGAMIGASIGFFPSFVEGKGNYSLRGAIRVGLIGALFGGIGGLLSFPPAEWLHIQLNAGIKGRMLAFGLVGLAVGIAEGINGGARPWRAILGGIIGGIGAGVAIGLLVPSQTTHADSGIIALIIIGFVIAAAISIFVNVLSDVWLEGLPGSKVHGNIYHLSKFRDPVEAVLGSGKKNRVYVYIPDAEERHATITLTRRGARLKHVANRGRTRVSNVEIQERMLLDNDIIEIGNSRLRYRERRKAVFLRSKTAAQTKAPV